MVSTGLSIRILTLGFTLCSLFEMVMSEFCKPMVVSWQALDLQNYRGAHNHTHMVDKTASNLSENSLIYKVLILLFPKSQLPVVHHHGQSQPCSTRKNMTFFLLELSSTFSQYETTYKQCNEIQQKVAPIIYARSNTKAITNIPKQKTSRSKVLIEIFCKCK